MRKLCVICLFLIVLFAFSVNAKVCFLPGVLSGDGCLLGEQIASCDGYTRTSSCPSNYTAATCIQNGKTYYKCTCKSGNYPMPNDKYICKGDYDGACGCATKDTYCNTAKYPFENCNNYDGATPDETDTCIDPATGKAHYKSCGCSKSIYPHDCKETGLKESRLASKCIDSNGKTYYSYCDCQDSWTSEPCSKNLGGCTRMIDSVDRGGGMGFCYSCGTEICPIQSNKNLEAYFCSVTPTVNTSCQSLGYKTKDKGDGICPDGSQGMKCIFDTSYMFCPNDLCYQNKKMCETAYKYSQCSYNTNGCWEASACKVGYYKEANDSNCRVNSQLGFYTHLLTDDNGCGVCASDYKNCAAIDIGYYMHSDTDKYYYSKCYNYFLSDGRYAQCCENRDRFYENCSAAGYYDYDEYDNIDYYSGIYIFTSKTGNGKTCYKNLCDGVAKSVCKLDFTQTCTGKKAEPWGTCKCNYNTKQECEKKEPTWRCGQKSNGCWYRWDCALAGYYDSEEYENADQYSGIYVFTRYVGLFGITCYQKLCSGTPRSECRGTFTKTCTGIKEDYGTCS